MWLLVMASQTTPHPRGTPRDAPPPAAGSPDFGNPHPNGLPQAAPLPVISLADEVIDHPTPDR